MRKIAKLTAIVAALLVGVISGVFTHRALSERPGFEREDLVSVAAHGEHAYRQYHRADYSAAKAALLEHARLLERVAAESGRQNGEPYATDIMISYVRLAKLEEKNNGSEKAGFMRAASVRCEQLRFKWDDCGEQALRRSVDRMDTITLR